MVSHLDFNTCKNVWPGSGGSLRLSLTIKLGIETIKLIFGVENCQKSLLHSAALSIIPYRGELNCEINN